MRLYVSSFSIQGVVLGKENPLPIFKDQVEDRPLTHDGSFSAAEEYLFGCQTGKKILPYKMQDRYTRDRSIQMVKTIVLENDFLKATFLPDYGARLYSLVDQKTGKDILYRNGMLQFGNLAQRNAWFSGGIEFNFGHYGHTALSNEPLFAAEVKDGDETFLRFYEYERVTGAFYQMDFHLPQGQATLDLNVRLLNPLAEDLPTYWWTNIAVPETPNCRVFSGASRVLAHIPRPSDAPDSDPCFMADEMPHLKIFDGDASYPSTIDHACEYFFLHEAERVPWEAVCYEDGNLFYEVSTATLSVRKMFCWGNKPGGKNWQRYLNCPSDTTYLEVQAGLAPSQLHGAVLPADSMIEFTQSFGHGSVDAVSCLNADWHTANSEVEKAVRALLSKDALYKRDEKYQKSADHPLHAFLHMGTGWGALEGARLGKEGIALPQGIHLTVASLSDAQLPWLALLNEGVLPCYADGQIAPWLTGRHWLKILTDSVESGAGKHWESLLHLGVMRMEAGDLEGARTAWEESFALCDESPITLRNLACYYKEKGNLKKAIELMKQASKLPWARGPAYIEELLELLVDDGQYAEVWHVYKGLAAHAQTDRIRIAVSVAALHLGKDDYLTDFFARELASIREGSNILTDVWFGWQAKQLGITEAQARAGLTPPAHIDFRMLV